MESPVRTSFIPKQAASPTPVSKPRSSTIGIFTLIAILIFVVALGASGALYFWKQTLIAGLEQKKATLTQNNEAFDQTLLQSFALLDKRMTAADTLLNKHLSPSLLFDEIEKRTLSTVRFRSFTLAPSSSVPGKMTLILNGEAKSFTSVALQADEFAKSQVLEDVVFADLNLDDQTGNAVFSVNAVIPSKEILFGNMIGPEPDQVTTVPDDTTTVSAVDQEQTGQEEATDVTTGGSVDSGTTQGGQATSTQQEI